MRRPQRPAGPCPVSVRFRVRPRLLLGLSRARPCVGQAARPGALRGGAPGRACTALGGMRRPARSSAPSPRPVPAGCAGPRPGKAPRFRLGPYSSPASPRGCPDGGWRPHRRRAGASAAGGDRARAAARCPRARWGGAGPCLGSKTGSDSTRNGVVRARGTRGWEGGHGRGVSRGFGRPRLSGAPGNLFFPRAVLSKGSVGLNQALMPSEEARGFFLRAVFASVWQRLSTWGASGCFTSLCLGVSVVITELFPESLES